MPRVVPGRFSLKGANKKSPAPARLFKFIDSPHFQLSFHHYFLILVLLQIPEIHTH